MIRFFYIDSGDASTDFIDLEFGTTLDAKLRYEIANDQFLLNRDLDLSSNEIQNARFETLPTAPTCDAASIGRFYYNTTDSLTYTCDGTVCSPLENVLNSAIEFPVVQARRTTTFTLVNAYTDIDLDTTDTENDVTALDHDDTLRDRVNIGEDGLYQIIYGYTSGGTATATHEARARVRANDTTVLEGSQSVNRNYQVEFSTTSASFLANLNAGDFITLQLWRDAVTPDTTQDDIFFSVVKLEGIKGDPGNDGSTDDNVFIIDNDDTGGDVTVQFGATLNEQLTWSDAGDMFFFSNDLSLRNNELRNFRIENLSASPVCNAGFVGGQYYDTDDNELFTCDGTRWVSNLKEIRYTGRSYLYNDTRWTTWSHNAYGPDYYQWNQSAGTAVDPVVSWAGIGAFLPAGSHITEIDYLGRANNTTVVDIEQMFQFRYPNPTTRWESGIDNSGEDLHDTIYRNFWVANTEPGQPALTGAINDIHRRVLSVDYVTPEDGHLDLIVQPTNAPGGTRYFYGSVVVKYRTTPQ